MTLMKVDNYDITDTVLEYYTSSIRFFLKACVTCSNFCRLCCRSELQMALWICESAQGQIIGQSENPVFEQESSGSCLDEDDG